MSWYVFLWVYSVKHQFNFWKLQACVSSKLESFQPWYILMLFSLILFFSSWDSKNTNTVFLLFIPHVTKALYFSFFSLLSMLFKLSKFYWYVLKFIDSIFLISTLPELIQGDFFLLLYAKIFNSIGSIWVFLIIIFLDEILYLFQENL